MFWLCALSPDGDGIQLLLVSKCRTPCQSPQPAPFLYASSFGHWEGISLLLFCFAETLTCTPPAEFSNGAALPYLFATEAPYPLEQGLANLVSEGQRGGLSGLASHMVSLQLLNSASSRRKQPGATCK